MALLSDIQNDAISDQVSVASLLRRCLVLAKRLNSQVLATWAQSELSGYSTDADLPPYRTVRGAAYGNFLGIGHMQRNHVLIPPSVLSGEHRVFATEIRLRAGVAEYESTIGSAKAGDLGVAWPGDVVQHYQEKLLKGWLLTSAVQPVPPGAIPGLLDSVRTRVLTFAMELEKEVPEDVPPDQIPKERVQQLIQNIIFGDNNSLAVLSPGASVGNKVVAGDIDSLASQLLSLGVSAADVEQLRGAIESDVSDGSSGPGTKVHSWYGTLAEKAAGGLTDVSTSVVGSAVWQAILAYFG